MRGVSGACGLGLIVGVGVGCWHAASGHCGNLDGDFTCAERGGGQYCDACQADGDGCSDVVPAEGCHFAGMSGGTSTGGIESTSSGEPPTTTSPLTADTSSEGTSSTTSSVDSASGSTTESAGCRSNEDCEDPATPVCVTGECVQCTATMPEACSAVSQVCDDATQTCVPCTAHDQCAGGAACNLFTNTCLPADAVFDVLWGNNALTSAYQGFAGSEATFIVHAGAYTDSFTVHAGKVVAFVPYGEDEVTWNNGGGSSSQLTVSAGSTVLLDRIDLVDGGLNEWLLDVQGQAWVDRAEIAPNNGGIWVHDGGELVLRNSLIGGGPIKERGLLVTDTSIADVRYTTVATLNNPAVQCSDSATVAIHDAIIVSSGGGSSGELLCVPDMLMGTATEAQVGSFAGNAQWFANFAGPGFTSVDLHLAADGINLFQNRAIWHTGDPLTDIDGQPRPTNDGTPDYPGGDVP
jgi:hypothetical protein